MARERPDWPRFRAVRVQARWPAIPEPQARLDLPDEARRALDVVSGDEVAVLGF